jgi:hypothetical protein
VARGSLVYGAQFCGIGLAVAPEFPLESVLGSIHNGQAEEGSARFDGWAAAERPASGLSVDVIATNVTANKNIGAALGKSPSIMKMPPKNSLMTH